MKIFIKLILNILIVVCTFSCRKNKNKLILNCTVGSTNMGLVFIEGAKVTLMGKKIVNGTYSSGYSDIANGTTAADGKYVFEINEDKVSDYRIVVFKSNYFILITDYSAKDLEAGKSYDLNFNIFPEAYIKLHIINQVPFNINDFIQYYFSSGNLNAENCCSNQYINGYGMNYDTTFKCKTYGGQQATLLWNVTKNNNTHIYSTNLLPIAFDTVFYEIKY